MHDLVKQQISWAINQWKGTMTVDELAQTIMEAPALVDIRKHALEEAAQLIDGAAKTASKEGDLKLKREYEFRAALIREL